METKNKQKLSFWLNTPFRRLYIRHFESAGMKNIRLEEEWQAKGRPTPPPHTIKQKTVRDIGRNSGIDTLVETGTFEGDMVAAMLDSFCEIHSIELFEEYYQRAVQRFRQHPNVFLYEGDSGVVIAEVLKKINKPVVFWLDGHYSGEATGKAAKETPIIQELEAIAGHRFAAEHIILIDDAHCFTGKGDYPTLDGLKEIAKAAGYSDFSLSDNIICIRKARQAVSPG